MKYTITKMDMNVTWDEEQKVGNVETSVWIGGIKTQVEKTVNQGLYLAGTETDACPVLCACLVDPKGQEVDRIFPLLLEEEMQFCMRVEEPRLWNAEEPYCYQLVLEIVEGENFCQDRRVEPIAFRSWKIVGGQTCMNDRVVSFRAVAFPDDMQDSEAVQKFLQRMKRTWKNTLLVKAGEKNYQLEKWCLEYGIYLLEEGKDVDAGWLRARLDRERDEERNPDFQLQVVQTGVLIENKSTFVDASEYELHYEIRDSSGKKRSENELCTEIPAGSSKYVDIPFERPDEPGEYTYRVSLRLKKDTAWAPKGYAVVSAETKISNLYESV